jgi:hypothetical protein
LFVGPTADATGLTNPAMIIFHAGDQYIQAALKNSLGTGSADWVAYGDNGTESQGWADMGFTSSGFNDANYTITGPGDGYLFVETFAGSYGGNLIIATGNLGTVKDIIFATDGFLTENEFGRISDSNNSFELTKTGATITFPDGSIQSTAYIGGGDTGNWTLAPGVNTVNFSVPINGTYSIWVRGNIPNGIVTYTATVVVTNTNVPVLGSSYGWYYAAGNALVLTAIPTQIVGTVNNISNAEVSTTTANVFTFGITNNSGSSQVVNWGYTKL